MCGLKTSNKWKTTKNYWTLYVIEKKKEKRKIVHYIKCGKSAKKHPKNVKLKFLTMEDIFG